MTINQEYISIPKDEYERLTKRDLFLSCLEAGGVDNWEWYGDALDNYNELLEDIE